MVQVETLFFHAPFFFKGNLRKGLLEKNEEKL